MDEFRRILSGYGVQGDRLDKMEKFSSILLETNKTFNLTRITSSAEMAYKHFLDSIVPDRLGLLPEGARVMDVGTGAGFPGIPLAILRPDLKITMMDAQQKKVKFIQMIVDELGINAVALQARAEELSRADGYRSSFDVVVSRAVAGLNLLIEICSGFCAMGGKFLAYKGAVAAQEAEAAEHAAEVMGLQLLGAHDAALPGQAHVILEYVKVGELPENTKYPRPFSKIKASPL